MQSREARDETRKYKEAAVTDRVDARAVCLLMFQSVTFLDTFNAVDNRQLSACRRNPDKVY